MENKGLYPLKRTKLYEGERVRIIKADGYEEQYLIGKTGIIIKTPKTNDIYTIKLDDTEYLTNVLLFRDEMELI